MPTPSKDYTREMETRIAQLKPGDMFIWLGCEGLRNFRKVVEEVPAEKLGAFTQLHQNQFSESKSQFLIDRSSLDFGSLRNRGVKLVYYQTEPVESCQLTLNEVDEIWDFSWHNIDNCKGQDNAPRQRYVPLAALPTPMTKQNEHPGALLFFGIAEAKDRPCWEELKNEMGGKLESEYSAWNDGAYQEVLRTHNIFLNLHKNCGRGKQKDHHNPITWRNPKLLNARGLIISQRAVPKDEHEFAGLIDFVELEDIPKKYQELANMSKTDRQKLADLRFEQFQARFHPGRIFEEAGII